MKRLFSALTVVAILTVVTGTASAQEDGFSTDTVASPEFPNDVFPSPPPSVQSVVFASHQGFDRVVFTLSGPVTGYRVGYFNRRDTIGGIPVITEGSAVINVTLTPIAGGIAGSPAPHIDERPGFPELRQVAALEDFEANVIYGLAVADTTGFRVVAEGNLLVVDIRVPAALAATGAGSVVPVAAFGIVLLLAGVVVIRRHRRVAAPSP